MFPIEPNFKPVKSSVIFACFFFNVQHERIAGVRGIFDGPVD